MSIVSWKSRTIRNNREEETWPVLSGWPPKATNTPTVDTTPHHEKGGGGGGDYLSCTYVHHHPLLRRTTSQRRAAQTQRSL